MRGLSLALALIAAVGEATAGTGSTVIGPYTYDSSGNIVAIGSDACRYDLLSRLSSATAGAFNAQSYAYDPYGNRTSASRSPGASNCTGNEACEKPSLSIDAMTNRVVCSGTAPCYDVAGNFTRGDTETYAYDAAGMMTQANIGASSRQFIYTAGDQRIALYDGFNWTWEVRGPDEKVLREFTSTNDNSAGFVGTLNRNWAKDYVWRDGLLLASENATAGGGRVTLHYHLDHLGTPRLVTDGAGVKKAVHTYYAYGAELYQASAESPEEAMKLTAHERDITGHSDALDYMHARYYSSLTGRFASIDPELHVADATHDGQLWNRYAYARNNPLLNFDPDGRSYLVFNGDKHTISLYSDGGKLLGTWDASNHPQNSASADPLNKGTYTVDKDDRTQPAKHSGSTDLKTFDAKSGQMVNVKDANGKNVSVAKDSPRGMYGSSGIIHIDVAGHPGIGVHSGREGVTDGYGNTGWQYATNGCIRTTDTAMKAISATIKSDPLTHVDVLAPDDRHWQP